MDRYKQPYMDKKWVKSFQHDHSMSTKSANKLLDNSMTNRLVTKVYAYGSTHDEILNRIIMTFLVYAYVKSTRHPE